MAIKKKHSKEIYEISSPKLHGNYVHKIFRKEIKKETYKKDLCISKEI